MKARHFDKKFDKGEDVSQDLDLSKARKPLLGLKRINVDFPAWVIEKLDREANRLGVTKQSLIRAWIAERLKELE
ncbi:MAG: CopG family transcriptional regulator [bacterium]